MINFVDATEVTLKNEYTEKRIVTLIEKFNKKIKDKASSSEELKLSTDYGVVEKLTEEEFEIAVTKAKEKGWELTKSYRGSSSYYSYYHGEMITNPAVTTYFLRKINPVLAPQNSETLINFEP